ncbi:MAG: J domain-containing protein [Myxococcota bacterium]
MSDPATVFRKFRDADDRGGDLAWSTQASRGSLKASSDAPPDVEAQLGLNDEESVLWRLLRVPRRYTDLENAGVLPPEQARTVLRALVAADVAVVGGPGEAKPLVPVEVARARKSAAATSTPPSAARAPLKARVYRPDISSPPPPIAPDSFQEETTASHIRAPGPRPASLPPRQGPPSEEERRLITQILQMHSKMPSQDHYGFLGVEPTATRDVIKQAYVHLAKDYHPDHIASQVYDLSVLDHVDAIFKRLQDAWTTLKDPEPRRAYDLRLAQSPPSGERGTAGRVRRPEDAKLATMKAQHLVKAKQYKEAEAQFRVALLHDDQHLPAHLGLAWAIFLNEGRDKSARVAEAKKLLLEVSRAQKSAEAHYRLALIARVEGDEAEVEQQIELAAKLDSKHPEVQQELRLIERRRQAREKEQGPTPSGLLESFTGKFKIDLGGLRGGKKS